MTNDEMRRRLLAVMDKYWGYKDFRPGQEQIMLSVLEGRDTLALMPTGGGKSLTYQVPVMARTGLCIVITPLIALMKDQVDRLRRMGIAATAIHSGLSYSQIDIALDNCVYGVDLNPVAVELAEVSLWLNALSDDKFVPWFGLQLHAGNSLIGCRRTVYGVDDVMGSKGLDLEPIDLGPAPLGERQIWQFLVPNPGMANYKDADVKAIYTKEMETLAKRRKELFRKVTENDIKKGTEAIKKASGEYPTAFRCPGGTITDTIRKYAGTPIYYWSVDTQDWKLKNAKKIYENIMQNTEDGDIILMHDIYETTIDAVEMALPKLAAKGFQFVTVSELMEAKGIRTENGKQYFSAASKYNGS